MKKVTYKCNLCLEDKKKNELLAFYWRCDKIPQGFVLSEDLDSTDKHICKNCIQVIKEEM